MLEELFGENETMENIELFNLKDLETQREIAAETGDFEKLAEINFQISELPVVEIEFREFDHFNQELNENIYGNPEKSMEYWEYQGETNRCALYAQKFVIEEFTGQEIDIEELADTAETLGFFSEDGGTPCIYMNRMLDYYGVENEVSYGNTIEDLEESLNSGDKVIVSLDSGEYWYNESFLMDLFDPANGPDHAVEVIGIDESDPENPFVILNDSGTPEGCGERIPLEVFKDAWEDGNNHMIVCKR